RLNGKALQGPKKPKCDRLFRQPVISKLFWCFSGSNRVFQRRKFARLQHVGSGRRVALPPHLLELWLRVPPRAQISLRANFARVSSKTRTGILRARSETRFHFTLIGG